MNPQLLLPFTRLAIWHSIPIGISAVADDFDILPVDLQLVIRLRRYHKLPYCLIFGVHSTRGRQHDANTDNYFSRRTLQQCIARRRTPCKLLIRGARITYRQEVAGSSPALPTKVCFSSSSRTMPAKSARLRCKFHELLIMLLQASLAFAQTAFINGSVKDPSGAGISGAEVRLSAGASSASTTTDSAGNFTFSSVPVTSGELTVRAAGFSDAHRVWNANDTSPVQITLLPALMSETVTVTATRIESRTEDIAANAVTLSAHDLAATPALLMDDKLRQVPGFTLFRRSSSRTSNPTSQGVSLNGLGASGASRALVLEDGVPVNDPFGGWIYWSRIPQQELSSVEVVRGGISSLYGSNAMAGVIHFLSREAEAPAMALELSYGSEITPDLSFWSGARSGKWDGAVAADLFHTDGYILVPVEQRGTVDSPANSEHAVVDVTVGHTISNTRIFGRGSYFTEGRDNGTAIQVNDTQSGEGVLGADLRELAIGSLALRVFGLAQGYNQSFSALTPDRNCESLTNFQHVPSQQVGGSALWTRSLRSRQTLVAGFDAAEVIGSSHERLFLSTGTCPDVVPNGTNVSGGRQRT